MTVSYHGSVGTVQVPTLRRGLPGSVKLGRDASPRIWCLADRPRNGMRRANSLLSLWLDSPWACRPSRGHPSFVQHMIRQKSTSQARVIG
jgi:hypothetical protein